MILNVEIEYYFLVRLYKIILENSLLYCNLYMVLYLMILNSLIKYLNMY